LTITVTESIRITIDAEFAVTDTVTVAEAITVFLPAFFMVLSESMTVVEAVEITLTVEPAAFPPMLFRKPKTYKRM